MNKHSPVCTELHEVVFKVVHITKVLKTQQKHMKSDLEVISIATKLTMTEKTERKEQIVHSHFFIAGQVGSKVGIGLHFSVH